MSTIQVFEGLPPPGMHKEVKDDTNFFVPVPLICPLCPSLGVFALLKKYKRHVLQTHKFQCLGCPGYPSFGDYQPLYRHNVRKHHDGLRKSEPIPCPKCPSKLSSRQGWQKHLKLHFPALNLKKAAKPRGIKRARVNHDDGDDDDDEDDDDDDDDFTFYDDDDDESTAVEQRKEPEMPKHVNSSSTVESRHVDMTTFAKKKIVATEVKSTLSERSIVDSFDSIPSPAAESKSPVTAPSIERSVVSSFDDIVPPPPPAPSVEKDRPVVAPPPPDRATPAVIESSSVHVVSSDDALLLRALKEDRVIRSEIERGRDNRAQLAALRSKLASQQYELAEAQHTADAITQELKMEIGAYVLERMFQK